MNENIIYSEKNEKISLKNEEDSLEQITVNRFHPIEDFNGISNCVCKIEKDGGCGTGFFLKIKNKEEELKLLITNEHIIKEEMIENISKITMIFCAGQNRTIELDRSKRKIECFNRLENEDITIVQILENDNVPDYCYLELDDNYYSNVEKEEFYEGKIVYLFHFPYSCDQYWSVGSISGASKENLSFTHDASTAKGSSGSPIIYNSSLKVIGVHGSIDTKNGSNKGIFLGRIINKFKQRINSNGSPHNRVLSQEYIKQNGREYYTVNSKSIEKPKNESYSKSLTKKIKKLNKAINHKKKELYYKKSKKQFPLFIRKSTKRFIYDYGEKYDRDDSPSKEENKKLNYNQIVDENSNSDNSYCCPSRNIEKNYFENNVFKTEYERDIDFKGKNLIECEYYVKDYKKVQYETKLFDNKIFKGFNKFNTEIFIDGIKVDFTSTYRFNTRNSSHKVKFVFTDDLINMDSMFKYCYSLTKADFSRFNAKKVTSMKDMFNLCYLLKYVDLSSFNTENVTNMTKMFYGCSSLIFADLSSFNTDNVINMEKMFVDCKELKEICLSKCKQESIIKIKKSLPKKRIKIIYPKNNIIRKIE